MSETVARLLVALILAGAIILAAYLHGGMYQMAGTGGNFAYRMNKFTGETTYYTGGIERSVSRRR